VREILSESKFEEDAAENFQDRMETLTTRQLEIVVSYYQGNLDCNTMSWRAGNEIAYRSAKKELDRRRSLEAEGLEEEEQEQEAAIEAAREAELDERQERDAVAHMARTAWIKAEKEIRETVMKEEQEKKHQMRLRMRQTAKRRKRYYASGGMIFGVGLIVTFLMNSTQPVIASVILVIGILIGGGVILLGYMRTRVLPIDVGEDRIERRIEGRAVQLLAEMQYENKRKMDKAKKEDRQREAQEGARYQRRRHQHTTQGPQSMDDYSSNSKFDGSISDLSVKSTQREWESLSITSLRSPGEEQDHRPQHRRRSSLKRCPSSRASGKYEMNNPKTNSESNNESLKSSPDNDSKRIDENTWETSGHKKESPGAKGFRASRKVVVADDIHLSDVKS